MSSYLLPELYTIVLEYTANRINKWKLHMTNSVLPELIISRKSLRPLHGKRRRRWPRYDDYGMRHTHYMTFCYDPEIKDLSDRKQYVFGNLGSIYHARSLLYQSYRMEGRGREEYPCGVVFIRCEDDRWSGRVFPFRGGPAFPQ